MKSKILILFCLLSAPLISQAHIYGPDCQELIRVKHNSLEKLGYLPLVRIEPLTPLKELKMGQRFLVSAFNPVSGTQLARLDFTIYDEGQTIHVEGIDVLNGNNRGKGLSNLLFGKMIEQYPQVQKVFVELADINKEIIEEGLRASDGLFEAFSKTPMFKTALHFGFKKIASTSDLKKHDYSFLLEREPAH